MTDCLEFHIEDESWRDTAGIVRLEGSDVIFEFRTKTLGLFQSSVQEVYLPLSDIAAVDMQYRLLHSFLRLQLRSLRAIEAFPGLKGATIRLKIKGWNSRDRVRTFVSELNYQRALVL